jgi:hypothetical protein
MNQRQSQGGVETRVVAVPGVSTLTLALCATFTSGVAYSAPVVVPIDPNFTLGTFNLDIDGNGTAEYTLSRTTFAAGFESVVTGAPNAVVSFNVPPPDPKSGDYAQALGAGELIDGSRNFNAAFNTISGVKGPMTYGEFYDSGFAFIGLRFDLPTTTGDHFGWIEVLGDDGTVTLTRYGYETDPNVGIVTPALSTRVPEPGSLALLIAGAAGVLAMRRRQRAS